MIKIETIQKDIDESLKNIDFVNRAIGSFESLNLIYKDSKPDIANLFKTDIENFQAIITVIGLEISLVLKGIHFSKTNAEKILLIKKGLLILFETKKVLDKLNPTIKNIKTEFPELENDFKEFIDILKQLKKRIISESRIEDIRNNTSAHFNSNFMEYYEFVQKIDLENDLDLIIRTRLILKEFDNFLLKVAQRRLIKRNTG